MAMWRMVGRINPVPLNYCECYGRILQYRELFFVIIEDLHAGYSLLHILSLTIPTQMVKYDSLENFMQKQKAPKP